MPQLDSVTFLSQFFWLCIVFSGLYLILVKFCLPSIARILKVRELIQHRSDSSFSEENQISGINSNNFSVVKKCFENYPAFEFEKETNFFFEAQNSKFTNQFATNYQKMIIANLVLGHYGSAKNRSFAQASMQPKGINSASKVFYYRVFNTIKNSKRILREASSIKKNVIK